MKYVAVVNVDNNILLRGDECITRLTELYEAVTDPECTEIILTKEFCDKFFTYTALCDFVENCGAVAHNATIKVEGVSYTDLTGAARTVQQYTTQEEMLYALSHNPERFIATVHELCKYYFENREEATQANNKVANAMLTIASKEKEIKRLEEELSKTQLLYNNTFSKLHALVNRVNFRYDKAIVPDEMFQVQGNQFKKILYIKEITRVKYTDTLLYYLQEIVKTLYSAPVRTVVIEPYYSYGRQFMYEYLRPHWQLTYQDVYAGNIFMAGFQPKLMKDILMNSNHLHYLIILDRGGYMDNHVIGGNVSTVYTVSDLNDAPQKALPGDIISYSENTLNIPYIQDFESLSPEKRVQKYSSMPVVQTLLNILEEGL